MYLHMILVMDVYKELTKERRNLLTFTLNYYNTSLCQIEKPF